jgi:lipopolysaccharide transport system ATP-binding protein
MSDTVIKVENLSKRYVLGNIGSGSLSQDLNAAWARFRGKEDPNAKLDSKSFDPKNPEFWALKNISFEVAQGEVLGIIGKNGAGKSTLLKVLSRITSPTSGQYKVKGRIASLLEVGTGFHPELTGRENLFLNGAILGMNKSEIKSKFDEIVEFSGVSKFIDTPVKRYSSGMYVRLAFAVAAHLEPEILIVDEVLAVGDAEFQKKCMGKMKDVSGQGRTVLFVSHNIAAIKSLCSKGLYLQNGQVLKSGLIEPVITEYLAENKKIAETGEIPDDFKRVYGNGDARFRKVYISDYQNNVMKQLPFGEKFKIHLEFDAVKDLTETTVSVMIGTTSGENFMYSTDNNYSIHESKNFAKGKHQIEIEVDAKLLPGNFYITAGISIAKSGFTLDWVENVYMITVDKIGLSKGNDYPWDTVHGYVEPATNWNYKFLN